MPITHTCPNSDPEGTVGHTIKALNFILYMLKSMGEGIFFVLFCLVLTGEEKEKKLLCHSSLAKANITL